MLNDAKGLLNAVSLPILVLDRELRLADFNAAAAELLDLTAESLGAPLAAVASGALPPPLEALPASVQVDAVLPRYGRRRLRVAGHRAPGTEEAVVLTLEDLTAVHEDAEVRFRRLFESAKEGILLVNASSAVVIDVNPYFTLMTGCAREALAGLPLVEAPPFRDLAITPQILREARSREMVHYDDVELSSEAGATAIVEILGTVYEVDGHPVLQLNVRDVSDRRRSLAAMRESEERLRYFVESVRDYALFQTDANNRIIFWNSGAERLLGWSEAEILGRDARIIFTPEDLAAGEADRELETARCEGRAEDERWHQRKDGSRFFASGVVTSIRDEHGTLRGHAKVMRDITERKRQEEMLHHSLEEKSILVREIHHRVKNNLQLIVSLLSIQAEYSKDPGVLAAFEDAEHRVRAIARLHERLYSLDDLAEVEFGTYLAQLARELLTLHAAHSAAVELELKMEDVVLGIGQAIPLGLIANELITNVLKHGLRGNAGRISILLNQEQANGRTRVQLEVADDGPGFPGEIDFASAKTMGLRLVSLLTKQLGGQLEVRAGAGAAIRVKFPLDSG